MDEDDLMEMIDYERQIRKQTAARNKAILKQVDERVFGEIFPVGRLSHKALRETRLRLMYLAAVLKDRRRYMERAKRVQ